MADAWQGRGIGGRLLGKLVEIARSRGLDRIHGDTLASNRPMIELAKKLRFAPARHPDESHLVRVTLALRG